MSVMKVLRARRLAAGLTQSEVAEALGIGQTAVSQWERYGVNPNADKLPQLAKLYGCKIDDLFDDTDRRKETISTRTGGGWTKRD